MDDKRNSAIDHGSEMQKNYSINGCPDHFEDFSFLFITKDNFIRKRLITIVRSRYCIKNYRRCRYLNSHHPIRHHYHSHHKHHNHHDHHNHYNHHNQHSRHYHNHYHYRSFENCFQIT